MLVWTIPVNTKPTWNGKQATEIPMDNVITYFMDRQLCKIAEV